MLAPNQVSRCNKPNAIYKEPITEEHPSTIGVCDNCPPLKEVINSP